MRAQHRAKEIVRRFWRALVPIVVVSLLCWATVAAYLIPEALVQAWLEGR